MESLCLKKNLPIICRSLKSQWVKSLSLPPIIHLLTAKLQEGISVSIVVKERGHNENDLSSIGFNIIHKPEHKLNCSIIDNKTTWYGDVNLIGKSQEDSSIIRLESPELVSSVYDSLTL
ncbi:MAG: hypothetical protein J1F38_10140 [Muribaculaceae bacterium]|nr:hypothetical protein [Muribaculaceae bacterium]